VPDDPIVPDFAHARFRALRKHLSNPKGRGLVDFAGGFPRAAVRGRGTLLGGTLLGGTRLGGALLVGALLASGCTTSPSQWWHNGLKVGPQYARPSAAVADQWVDSADARVKSEPAQDCAWWTVFNDATLNGLIESAYRQNLDLRAAGTRILESRAQRNMAIGNLFPQSQTALADFAHAQLSKNLGLPLPSSTLNVWADGLNLSWEIDFWGRYRRSIEGSEADLDASVESYGDTLVLLLSEVATSYVQLRTYEQRLQFARQNVTIQKRTLQLADARFRTGRGTELDVRQSRSTLAQTESLIPPLVTGRRQAANQLCTLLGVPVANLADQLQAAPIPNAPLEVAVGIPADLMRRRPDVRRAERQVAAQSARVGVAEADLYPRVSLNGFVGFVADDFKDLFAAKSFTGLFFPTMQWNVLSYGRVRNNIKAQDERLEGATFQYQQTVLNAGREVEDALAGFLQAQQQATFLEDSVRDAQRSVELVLMQFEGGVVDFNRVYNTQTTLLTAQDQLATTRGNIALQLIQVYKALGGGWLCFLDGCGMPRFESADLTASPSPAVPSPAVPSPAVPPTGVPSPAVPPNTVPAPVPLPAETKQPAGPP
jgi:NodT family efflux transporter outer membrane factor (OMF) lipoprotein